MYPEEKPLEPTAKHIEVQEKDPKKGELSLEVASYHEEIAPIANQLALLGLKDKEIAETFGVSKKCFLIWQETYPELCEVLNDARNLADARVAQALYQRAVGYDYTEDRTFIDRESGRMETIEVKKHCMADVPAAKAWLSSRRPEQWRESKNIHVKVAPKKKLTELFDDCEIVEGEVIEDDD